MDHETVVARFAFWQQRMGIWWDVQIAPVMNLKDVNGESCIALTTCNPRSFAALIEYDPVRVGKSDHTILDGQLQIGSPLDLTCAHELLHVIDAEEEYRHRQALRRLLNSLPISDAIRDAAERSHLDELEYDQERTTDRIARVIVRGFAGEKGQ